MGVNQGYPASWYAATRNNDVAYPELTGQVSADVCIIGAGFSGLSTAIYLAEQGREVVLLEANRVGWGASGRNGGQLVCGYGHDTHHLVTRTQGAEAGERAYELGHTCLSLVQDMVNQYKINCSLTYGYVRLALTERQARKLQKTADEWKRLGAPGKVRYMDKDELKNINGSAAYRAGLYTDIEGHLHPLNLALGEARALTELGGRIFERSAATNFDYTSSGGPVHITTENGGVRADTLVLCGNAYLEKLEPALMPTLIPGYSGIIATEPLSSEFTARIMPNHYACSDLRTVVDYYRLTPDNRLLWGGLAHWSGDDSADPRDLLRRSMSKVFPDLAKTRIDYAWTGRIGVSANWNPQIGRLAPHVYYAQAYSGHGVASTHLSGRMIADAITGHGDGARDFDMFAKIRHLKIPPYGPVRKLARAWGMNSRRVMDWF